MLNFEGYYKSTDDNLDKRSCKLSQNKNNLPNYVCTFDILYSTERMGRSLKNLFGKH